jgi:hypothetical protein
VKVECLRVYLNGEREIRQIERKFVAEWVKFNSEYRFGVGLFVDAKCVWKGYLSDEIIAQIERERAWVKRLPTDSIEL